MNSVADKEPPGIILRIADEIEITAILVARFILEGYLRKQQSKQEADYEREKYRINPRDQDEETNEINQNQADINERTLPLQPVTWTNLRAEVTRLLRDTTEIENRDLAYEVYLCTVHDDHYGPIPDAIRQTVGAEYEDMLSDQLKDLKVCFLDENQLRQKGYDKTPDVKLDVPIAVEGRVVNWIESKATFGDEETHQNYLDEQLTSYWNRFGPGLVIYWLGYVETLESRTTKSIFVRDHMPTAITYMDPKSIPVHHESSGLQHRITQGTRTPFDLTYEPYELPINAFQKP